MFVWLDCSIPSSPVPIFNPGIEPLGTTFPLVSELLPPTTPGGLVHTSSILLLSPPASLCLHDDSSSFSFGQFDPPSVSSTVPAAPSPPPLRTFLVVFLCWHMSYLPNSLLLRASPLAHAKEGTEQHFRGPVFPVLGLRRVLPPTGEIERFCRKIGHAKTTLAQKIGVRWEVCSVRRQDDHRSGATGGPSQAARALPGSVSGA